MAAPSNADPDDRFALGDQAQINTLLRRMIDQRSLIDAALPGNGPSLLTSILDVDEDDGQLVFDASADVGVESLALAQRSLKFSSRIDRVDIRFETGPLRRTSFEGLPAYQAPLPRKVTYLQRREFFRIEIPAAHPVNCQLLSTGDDTGPPRQIRTRVNDISAGGLSLVIPYGEEAALAPGARFATCQLMLPDNPPVLIGLRVRRLFRASKPCAGCEYLSLSTSAQTAIQRFMMRLERERIARERSRI